MFEIFMVKKITEHMMVLLVMHIGSCREATEKKQSHKRVLVKTYGGGHLV